MCGRRLLAVPPARPGQPRQTPMERAGRRLRALLPAAGAVGAALLILAAVASAFAAGRLTRTTPAAQGTPATTTVPGFLDEGPETGRRDFNWTTQANGLTVQLRSITVGTGFSRLELHFEGVRRGLEVSALQRLRIRDGDGRDLLPGGELASVATAASRPATGRGVDAEVVLDRAIDQQAVASVELGGVTIARFVEDVLAGSLVDAELQRRVEQSPQWGEWLAGRRGCPGCELQLSCQDCRSVRLLGWSYRRGRVVAVVQALGPVERSAINPERRRVVATDVQGVSELSAWIGGTGDTAVVSLPADELAAAAADGEAGESMGFEVELQAQAEESLRGPWTIQTPGGSG